MENKTYDEILDEKYMKYKAELRNAWNILSDENKKFNLDNLLKLINEFDTKEDALVALFRFKVDEDQKNENNYLYNNGKHRCYVRSDIYAIYEILKNEQ